MWPACALCVCSVCDHVSVRVVGLLCMQAPRLYLPLCGLLHAPMSIYKRCLRAYRFPCFFHFRHSGKTKSDTWVNEQTAEVIWGDTTVDFPDIKTRYLGRLTQIPHFSVAGVGAVLVCVYVCDKSCGRNGRGECWILSVCDREKGQCSE